MDLTEFLTARYDEEAAALERIEDHSEPWRGEWEIKNGTLYTHNGWCLAVLMRTEALSGQWRPGVLEHIVRYDPSRVLADIAAKRRILERHSSYDFPADEDDGPGDYAWTPSCDHCFKPWPCPDLLDLAAQYADRPGFDPTWTVQP